jgi:hypothetical protein
MSPVTRLPVLVILALAVLPGAAHAALTTSHLASDAELFDLTPTFDLIAEGRIGDRGGAATFELDIGPETSHPFITAQHPWQSGVLEPFTLAYDITLHEARFSLGGHTLIYPTPLGADELFVRTRAVNQGTSVLVQDLILDGEAVGDVSQASDGSLDILRIQGGLLTDGFVLTGNAVLTWTGTPPTQSRLAFQVKVGTTFTTPVTPSTWGKIKALYR